LGGGLGGGSSDAATVLRLLEDEHGALGSGGCLEIARDLGSDVPFLWTAGETGAAALATGRGDVLDPLPSAPPVAVVLVMPPIATETALVYSRFRKPLRGAPPAGAARAAEALASGVPSRIRGAHHNDLAETVLRAYPAMLRFTSLVERLLGRPPCMTGSGSTLFDVPDPGEVADVVGRLRGLSARVEATTTA
jgi:4-diphosphocytidyl-2-C-methyl-D-erythritol kinase